MKLIWPATLLCFSFVNILKAEHRFGINADNITFGTLKNERLDKSSVTLRGNAPFLLDGTEVIRSSHIAGGFSGIIGSEVVFATNTKRGVLGGVLSNEIGVVASSNILDRTLLQADIALKTIDAENAVTGINGGLLSNHNGVISSSHIIGGTLTSAEMSPEMGSAFLKVGNGGVIFSSHIFTGAGSLHSATGTLRSDLTATGVATGTLRTDLGISTQNLKSEINGINAATATYINTSGSTQTKSGGLFLSGSITASSATIVSSFTAPIIIASSITSSSKNLQIIANEVLQIGTTNNFSSQIIIEGNNIVMPTSGTVFRIGGTTAGTGGDIRVNRLLGSAGNLQIVLGSDSNTNTTTTTVNGNLRIGNRVIGSGTKGIITLADNNIDMTTINSSLTVTNSVTATKFVGDGSGLTGVVATSTASTIKVLDEGILKGNIGTLDIVGENASITVSGTTGTLTITGGGGGGGGGIRTSRIVVGTSATQNVDIVSTNHNGLKFAISSITAEGQIVLREGKYVFNETVIISSKVTVLADRNAVITHNNGIVNAIRLQGKWIGGRFVGGNLASVATSFIKIEDDGVMQDCEIVDTTATASNVKVILINGERTRFVNNLIQNNNFSNSTSAGLIKISNLTKNLFFVNNTIRDNGLNHPDGSNALEIDTSGPYLISGLQMINNSNGLHQISIFSSSGGAIITNSYFEQGTSSTPINITVTNPGGDERPSAYGINFTNNTIRGNPNNRVTLLRFLDGSSVGGRTIISANTISNNIFIDAAMAISFTSTGDILRDNLIHGNSLIGGGTFYSESSNVINNRRRDNVINGTSFGDN